MKNFFTTLIKRNNDNPPQQNNEYKNFAFISHGGDKKEAIQLEKFLSSYRVPTTRFQGNHLPNSLKEIFLDVKNMKGNSVPDALRPELHDSLNLIVICSSAMKEKERIVESAPGKTAYVNQEISIFVEEKKGNDTTTQEEKRERFKHIYLLNVDGDYQNNYPRQFCKYAEEFHIPLNDIRVIDLTKATKKQVNEYHGCVSGAYVNLIAGILQLDSDELWKCYKRYRLKKILLSTIMSLVILIMIGLLITILFRNEWQRKQLIVRYAREAELKAENATIFLNPFMVQECLLKALPNNLNSFRRFVQLSSEVEGCFRNYSEDNIVSVVNFVFPGCSPNVGLCCNMFKVDANNMGFLQDGNIFVHRRDGVFLIFDVFGFPLDTVFYNNRTMFDELINLSDGIDKNSTVFSYNLLPYNNSYVNSIVFSPDKKYIATASNDSAARVWKKNGDSLKIEKIFKHGGCVKSAMYSRDGRYLITTSSEGCVRIWDWKKGEVVDSLVNNYVSLRYANFNWNNKKIVTIEGATVKVWDLTNHSAKKVVDSIDIPYYVNRVVFSRDDKRLLLIGETCWAVWERREKLSPVFKDNNYSLVCIANLSPDGEKYTVLYTKSIRLFDTKSFVQCDTIHVDYNINSCVYSLDGKYLVTSSPDGLIRIYDAKSKKEIEISPLRGHTGPVNHAVFSPDGKIIVSSSSDSTVRLWDLKSGRELKISPLKGHRDAVNFAIFSMDGKYIVSSSCDKTVRRWSIGGGKGKTIFEFDRPVAYAIPHPNMDYYIVGLEKEDNDRYGYRTTFIESNLYNALAKPNNESVKTICDAAGACSYFSADGNYIVASNGNPLERKIQEFFPLQQLIDEAKKRIKARTENQENYKKNKQ